MGRAGRWLLSCRPFRAELSRAAHIAAGPFRAASAAVLLTLLLAPPAAFTPAAHAGEAAGKPQAGEAAGKPQTGLKTVPLVIFSGQRAHHYRVEVAQTPAQQATGMMFRTSVPPATGMIFPSTPPRQVQFWMRNTLVPLDLLFIGADGRIRNIIADAVPHSEAPLGSLGEVVAVLELAGGEAARAGIKPGDRVRW